MAAHEENRGLPGVCQKIRDANRILDDLGLHATASVTMSRLDYFWDSWNINAMLIHEPRFDKLTRFNGEFFPANSPLPPLEKPDWSWDNQQAGMALNGIFSGWDISFYGASVFQERAYITADETGALFVVHEAALKFFIIGVVAFALLVMGVSLLYGISGTQLFAELAVVPQSIADEPVFVLGMLFVFLGFAFKISAVPFHVWTPDVYEGSPTPVTAWLSVGSKGAGFVGVLTVAYLAFPDQSDIWGPLLWILAALSMTIGNLVAIQQTNIVRLLGYSSIAQAGFMLAPFAVAGSGPLVALQATINYLVIYAAMNLGAFAVIIAITRKTRSAEIDEVPRPGIVEDKAGSDPFQ